MRTEEVSIYTFEELSDKAKVRAREWYREGALDYDWWDGIYDDASRIFAILGIDSQKPVKLMNGSTRYDPAIWFSGFWSQGDGACFTGSYAYAKASARAIARYAPQNMVLQRIGRDLMNVQKRNRYGITANITKTGLYEHEHSVSIDVDGCNADDQKAVAELLRDLMRWIYRALEKEHEYLMSDECVDETIVSNEYEFTADGAPA